MITLGLIIGAVMEILSVGQLTQQEDLFCPVI